MLTPYLDTLFVHDRAILIQIEPLAAFDSQHTNIGISFILPFLRLKAAHFQYWKFVWSSNRSVRAVRFFLSEIRILFLS